MKVYIKRIETRENPLEIWYGTNKDNLDCHYIMYNLRFVQGTNTCGYANQCEPNHLEMDKNQNLLFDNINKQIISLFALGKIGINIGMNEFDVKMAGEN